MKQLEPTKTTPPKDTAHRILIEAMRIFLEKGYHGTSIDDITRAAGVTKGALYWHFKSKEDLIRKIIEEFDKKFFCRIRTHKKFGTAIILFSDGLKIDVATARLEIYDSPAALPTVEKGSIKMGRNRARN